MELFLRCGTRWQLAMGMGSAAYTGLDYAGVEALMNGHGIKRKHRPELWDALQVMEAVALEIKNKRLAASAKRQSGAR